ncbi:hypothetical protein ACIO93_35530 [Streptomyces sp. NPDC087903]|uniref:hypothetical protein n=1 Tax=Streptomyces sp. NPDC087903 TaxID=3365819 RepID=UPI0037F15748
MTRLACVAEDETPSIVPVAFTRNGSRAEDLAASSDMDQEALDAVEGTAVGRMSFECVRGRAGHPFKAMDSYTVDVAGYRRAGIGCRRR